MIINLPPLCQNEPTRGQNEALDPLYTSKWVLAPDSFNNSSKQTETIAKNNKKYYTRAKPQSVHW